MEIVERIFKSFRKMKEDQRNVSDVYLPSSLWQKQLDNSFSYLTEGLKKNDVSKFHFFLSNFGTWKKYHGVESTTLIRSNMRSSIRRQYLKNVIFYQQLKIWKWYYNNRKQIYSLTYPTHGNQSGAYIDKIFVGVGSFFNEIYGSILSGLLDDIKRPVVADLGAGYGKLAYFTLRDMKNSCFIDFDLPETLCLAAYYLMKSWPHKQTLLYGEGEYSTKAHDQYDLIFMPSYEICKVGQNTVDLFMNKNSLGEMTSEATTNYVDFITKSTMYFFHMNHDNYPNYYSGNNRGLLGHEYPVPMDKFKLLFRSVDIGHILHKGRVNYSIDIFLYLYERKDYARGIL
ncbi:MAG: putative sugar O-methyltransferase [Candidatus Scalindua sp.]|nr:putative sugar O-methyltransferase [Candidatus Scalindua sp.]